MDLTHEQVMDLKKKHAEAVQELPCECKAKTHLDLTRPVRSKTDCMKAYNKAYRDKHSGMITCECGATFKEISKYTHSKSTKHQEYLQSK